MSLFLINVLMSFFSFQVKLVQRETWLQSFKMNTAEFSSFYKVLVSAQKTFLLLQSPKSLLRRRLWRSKHLKSSFRDLWVCSAIFPISITSLLTIYKNVTFFFFFAPCSPQNLYRQTSTVLSYWSAMALRNFSRLRGTSMQLRIWMFLYRKEILWVSSSSRIQWEAIIGGLLIMDVGPLYTTSHLLLSES